MWVPYSDKHPGQYAECPSKQLSFLLNKGCESSMAYASMLRVLRQVKSSSLENFQTLAPAKIVEDNLRLETKLSNCVRS